MTERKTSEEIALIAKDVINLLADHLCTVDDAEEVFRVVQISIGRNTLVTRITL